MAKCADDKHDFEFDYVGKKGPLHPLIPPALEDVEWGMHCDKCGLTFDEEDIRQRLIHFYLTYPAEFMHGLWPKEAGTHGA